MLVRVVFSSEHDTLVLDSEWHWIFDCPGFNEIRFKMPYFSNYSKEIRKNVMLSEIHDLGNLMKSKKILD